MLQRYSRFDKAAIAQLCMDRSEFALAMDLFAELGDMTNVCNVLVHTHRVDVDVSDLPCASFLSIIYIYHIFNI